jgi:hypothetical protein
MAHGDELDDPATRVPGDGWRRYRDGRRVPGGR